jgi:hypothetical protein
MTRMTLIGHAADIQYRAKLEKVPGSVIRTDLDLSQDFE